MSATQAQRDAERDLRTLRGQVDPLLQTVTPTTYLALQKMSDERAGHYVHDMVEQGDDIVRSTYGGAKYGRLGTQTDARPGQRVPDESEHPPIERAFRFFARRTLLLSGTASGACRTKGRNTRWQTTARPSSSS
jgi:hypothetical protein